MPAPLNSLRSNSTGAFTSHQDTHGFMPFFNGASAKAVLLRAWRSPEHLVGCLFPEVQLRSSCWGYCIKEAFSLSSGMPGKDEGRFVTIFAGCYFYSPGGASIQCQKSRQNVSVFVVSHPGLTPGAIIMQLLRSCVAFFSLEIKSISSFSFATIGAAKADLLCA
jgi:hypothetical protein